MFPHIKNSIDDLLNHQTKKNRTFSVVFLFRLNLRSQHQHNFKDKRMNISSKIDFILLVI
jgi:hypothetical protein